jgi:exodeoxyribonuclease-1
LWLNFYDPYEWCYKDGRSRWDMLDVVRMTRALRPDDIVWPVDKKGQPTNRLEELAKANTFDHTHAHDALSDVMATIQLAQLIKQKQPRLFDYLLDLRQKAKVSQLVSLEHPEPFVYSSGRYGKDKSFTTIGTPIAPASRDGGVVVYDLSVNPEPFFEFDVSQLKEKLFAPYEQRQKPDFVNLPVKELFYNKVPAVAPISVMDDASWQRLELDKGVVMKHADLLAQHTDFAHKLAAVYQQKPAFAANVDVEEQLYDGFTNDADKPRLAVIRAADAKALADFTLDFKDKRLSELFVRYKARNFPQALSEDEQQAWETYRSQKFAQSGPRFMQDLQKLAAESLGNENTQFLIEELRLWCESVAPLE